LFIVIRHSERAFSPVPTVQRETYGITAVIRANPRVIQRRWCLNSREFSVVISRKTWPGETGQITRAEELTMKASNNLSRVSHLARQVLWTLLILAWQVLRTLLILAVAAGAGWATWSIHAADHRWPAIVLALVAALAAAKLVHDLTRTRGTPDGTS
jgi:hypothetical protein